MSSNYLEIIRPGINTTFQDKGRDYLYHIGVPFSGAMDNRNYLIANKLVNNTLDSPVIELSLIHISEPTRQAEISYAVFCLKKKKNVT